jgi:hypothetical protein
MTNKLEKMFETLTNQLKNVKNAIIREYDSFSTSDQGTFPQCCKINGTYNPKFRTEVTCAAIQ